MAHHPDDMDWAIDHQSRRSPLDLEHLTADGLALGISLLLLVRNHDAEALAVLRHTHGDLLVRVWLRLTTESRVALHAEAQHTPRLEIELRKLLQLEDGEDERNLDA
jgi:hypothetical protein